jgi:hypothetical protein
LRRGSEARLYARSSGDGLRNLCLLSLSRPRSYDERIKRHPRPLETFFSANVRRKGCRPLGGKGYDYGPVHTACEERGVAPIISRRRFANEGEWTEHPTCEHGAWTFAGADFKRKATKWRCPSGECQPKSVWMKADRRHPLVPRSSKRFSQLYAGRSAVEREFGRLKNEYGLTPLRVRGRERVALHADLTMLARLSLALARARAVPLAA